MRSVQSVFRRQSMCVALVLSFAAFPAALHGQGGRSGLSFLKLPLEARATALGDAVTAAATGTGAVLSNPAGMASVFTAGTSMEVSAVYKQWIQKASLQFLGAGFRIGDGEALAVSVAASSSGDIEVRSRPGPSEGTFSARNVMVAGTYARHVTDVITAGITVKFLYEKIFVDEAAGFGFDAGIRWDAPVDGLVLGASVLHLGGMQELRSESTRLPASLRAGAAWSGRLTEDLPLVSVGVDLIQNLPEKRTTVHGGVEVSLLDVLALRAGYQAGESSRNFSAGLGIMYGIAGLDYAFAPLSEDLGSTHTIGVRLLF